MNLDLLELFNSTLGGPLIRQASTHLGESEESTRAAVRTVGPTLLAGLMQRAGTPGGAADIFRAVTDQRIDAGATGKIASVFDNRGGLESLLSTGEALSGQLFGGRSGSVMNAISAASGVRPDSAMTLVSLGLPLLYGMLKKYVTSNGHDASSLASLLLHQKRSLEHSAIDNRVAGALGFGSVPELLESLSTTAPSVATTRVKHVAGTTNRSWLPWAVAAGVAALGILFVVSRTADQQGTERAAVEIAEIPDSSEPLRVATADSAQVYFQSGEASIDREDRTRLASVAESAKQSDRTVGITGYTDTSGDVDQNLELAKNRQQAVRQALVSEGVQEEKIVVEPPREVTGSGTDSEAQRVDVDVR